MQTAYTFLSQCLHFLLYNKRCTLNTIKNVTDNKLSLYHTCPILNDPENFVGKEKKAGNQHFLLLPQCFSTFKSKFYHFTDIFFVVCKCFHSEQV